MNKEELLKKYNIEGFLKLSVEEQANFINKAYAQGITDRDLVGVFGVSPSTFLFQIRNKYKKKRNTNKFYRKEDLNKSDNKNLAVKSDNKNKNLDIDSKVVSIDEIKEIKNEILALKKEIDLLKQNKIDDNKSSNLMFNVKDKDYNNKLVLRHYKLNENIANKFDEFCNEAIINKQVLLGKALQEFLDKYNK